MAVAIPTDLTLQLDLTVRMLIAAALGAAIGFEREIHEHPAGMRTHLLVALGSAIFTELSIYGFAGTTTAPIDPSRVAAQVVSGIGFLGAGAILKYGTSIRGLTTAASLWAAAAIGMAAGTGAWVIGVIGTSIVIFSLWPLNALVDRVHPPGTRAIRMRMDIGRLEALGDISRLLAARRVEMAGISSLRRGKGHYEIELDLRVPPAMKPEDIVEAITSIADVELLESAGRGE
jgi:putative Mg2+ transporter-C (MgtC) family protein